MARPALVRILLGKRGKGLYCGSYLTGGSQIRGDLDHGSSADAVAAVIVVPWAELVVDDRGAVDGGDEPGDNDIGEMHFGLRMVVWAFSIESEEIFEIWFSKRL